MLEITIPGKEWLDERTNEFIYTKPTKLILEHSLLSLSKWEAKWKKPYFDDDPNGHKIEETLDYIRCMTVNGGVDSMVYFNLTGADHAKIQAYINDSMTGTTFKRPASRRSHARRIVTSELIYYWMISYGIPFECQKWHLNRLFALIDVCAQEGNKSNKKMSKKDIMKENAALNAARRAKLNTTG